MNGWKREADGKRAGGRRDILLIDDGARPADGRCFEIAESDGACVITAQSAEAAIRVLNILVVDEVFYFPKRAQRADAERLRSHIARRLPAVRLIDPWSVAADAPDDEERLLLSLACREGLDCAARRSLWREWLVLRNSASPAGASVPPRPTARNAP